MIANEVEVAYNVTKSSDLASDRLIFKKILLSEDSPEAVEFHYNLLRDRENLDLHFDIRAYFAKRNNIEGFLLNKLKIEEDRDMQSDILHLLGRINSSHASIIARQFINHEDKNHREVASYVLGWSGTRDDIALLQDHMMNEEDPQLRITAASAHRQMVWRHPELKYPILKSLQKGFETEKDDEVLSWIIVMIGTIALKPLGIREDNQEPWVLHGNLEKAKKRTRAFLDTLA